MHPSIFQANLPPCHASILASTKQPRRTYRLSFPPHASHTSKSHCSQHHHSSARLSARPHPPSHVKPAASVALLHMVCPAWHRGSPSPVPTPAPAPSEVACLARPRKYGWIRTPFSIRASASASLRFCMASFPAARPRTSSSSTSKSSTSASFAHDPPPASGPSASSEALPLA